MNRRIFERLQESFTPKWALRDPAAQEVLRTRIAANGARGRCITYSDLVAGVEFNVLPDKPGYTIDVHAWDEGFNRNLIGDFLGELSLASYRQHCFLLSALVVLKETGVPSDHFMRWVAHANEIDVLAATVIWDGHRRRAISYFKQDGSFDPVCGACPL